MDQETSLDRTCLWHDELLCNVMEGRMVGTPPTDGRRGRRLQMLDDLYENNSYEVLKRTTEDRSAWGENTRMNVPKTC